MRCWIECDGHVLMGRGRADLLERIERHRSISAAARAMDMSYRRAWLLVQSMNSAAGEPLVVAITGGKAGGGAELTPRGRELLKLFRTLDRKLRGTADKTLPALVADGSSKGPEAEPSGPRRARVTSPVVRKKR